VHRRVPFAKEVAALRLLIDGSFVTANESPNEIDAVILLPDDFRFRIDHGQTAALELENMILTRRPEELLAADTSEEWSEWVEFFSRTRTFDRRRKRLVEVRL